MSNLLNTMTSLATLALAAMPLAAVPAFAYAEEVRIPVGDLSFTRPADTQEFIRRVDLAAGRLCRNGPPSLAVNAACRAAVREEAIAKLGPLQRDGFQAVALHRAPGMIVRASAD